MDALCYKIEMDKYYRDVEIDMDSVAALMERPTNFSSRLQYVDSHVGDIARMDTKIERNGPNCLHSHSSSFLSHFPNE